MDLSDAWYWAARFDRTQNILQVEMNTGERFQYFDVPLALALRFIRSTEPCRFLKEHVRGYRVRARSRMATIWPDAFGNGGAAELLVSA